MSKWAWHCCWFTKTDNKDSCGSWMGGFSTAVASFFHFITHLPFRISSYFQFSRKMQSKYTLMKKLANEKVCVE